MKSKEILIAALLEQYADQPDTAFIEAPEEILNI